MLAKILFWAGMGIEVLGTLLMFMAFVIGNGALFFVGWITIMGGMFPLGVAVVAHASPADILEVRGPQGTRTVMAYGAQKVAPAPYLAAVILKEERNQKLCRILCDNCISDVPVGWGMEFHHMTVDLGSAAANGKEHLRGRYIELKIVSVGRSDKAIALGVEPRWATGERVLTCNETPHVTILVNRRDGGKPKDSNEIKDWVPLEPKHQFSMYAQFLEVPARSTDLGYGSYASWLDEQRNAIHADLART